ncbi:SDR family NAD(P)-dependent oxidoreductase [Phenylobacterium sp.]|uniref:SDR family NAD(P)-dependent oxidoreductase n=1 Tax=Phenylobacterium sp. TaxID=1871053 RepID=UPI0035ADB425
MDRLKGKVAIITGAALGIGRATAVRMAEEGASVAVLDMLVAEGEALAADLTGRGLSARFWRCDVTSEVEVERVIGEVAAAFGRLDVLVNNAGVSGASKPTHEVTEAEWDFVQAVNVKGVFFCTKHAIPHLRAAGGGSIIHLSSIYGLVGAADAPPYHASKGAVRLMAKTDAMIYAPDRIRVNSIHPGFIQTPMVLNALSAQEDGGAEAREGLVALHPLGHLGDPDDIAWGAVYLASDEARFVTGAELVIDGGYTAR